MGNDAASVACNTSSVISKPGCLVFPVDVKTYNLDALDNMLDRFSRFASENADFAGSFVMIEQYPTQGVRERKGHGVVPWRENGVLM